MNHRLRKKEEANRKRIGFCHSRCQCGCADRTRGRYVNGPNGESVWKPWSRRSKVWIGVYVIDRRYGGSEEGGWYYDWYEPVFNQTGPGTRVREGAGKTLEEVYGVARLGQHLVRPRR